MLSSQKQMNLEAEMCCSKLSNIPQGQPVSPEQLYQKMYLALRGGSPLGLVFKNTY